MYRDARSSYNRATNLKLVLLSHHLGPAISFRHSVMACGLMNEERLHSNIFWECLATLAEGVAILTWHEQIVREGPVS
jgi:hypothetical protein